MTVTDDGDGNCDGPSSQKCPGRRGMSDTADVSDTSDTSDMSFQTYQMRIVSGMCVGRRLLGRGLCEAAVGA